MTKKPMSRTRSWVKQSKRSSISKLSRQQRSTSSQQKLKPEESQYFAFWKPYNVLSQFTPGHNSSADTLSSYISIKGIYATGRLDRDSEGLLLLSNDGLFQHKLCDPRFEHWRTYLVQVEGCPDQVALQDLSKGVIIKGKKTRPAKVILLNSIPKLPPRKPAIRYRKNIETSWLRLSLTEGMNRQVRRMTAAVGFPTLRLVRESISFDEDTRISVLGLKPGKLRTFTPQEVEGALRLRNSQPSRK